VINNTSSAVIRTATRATKPAFFNFRSDITSQTVNPLINAVFQQISNGATEVHLLLSTGGGEVAAGMYAYNMLKGLPVPLTTHNVGNVDSIGNAVFLAGTHRVACKHSTFMFHSVGMNIAQPMRLELKNLRELLGTIDADQTRIAGVICERTKFPIENVKELFLEAQTKDAQFALEKGFIHAVRDVEVPPGAAIVTL
jgi:ATP-dependent protease ClpP protease subunit